MDHPLFDPKGLSDDELLDKLQKSRQYLGQQTQLGHDYTVTSIESVVAALEGEQVRRFTAERDLANKDDIKKDLNTINIGKVEEIDTNKFDMDPEDIARSYKK